jgi:hypothetical protein
MLRLAAVGAFDVLVLMSGDADHSPAVEGVRALGRQAYVASWGGLGLSSRLRKSAFDHIDLSDGLPEFTLERATAPAGELPPERTEILVAIEAPEGEDAQDPDALFLEELRVAEAKFSGRYVGVNYFVTRWRSRTLDASPIVRRRVLNRLVAAGQIELYDAPNGEKAMKRKG